MHFIENILHINKFFFVRTTFLLISLAKEIFLHGIKIYFTILLDYLRVLKFNLKETLIKILKTQDI